jgi:predicted flap endonuclease-1-like 5' DNA nuclease
MSHRVVVAATAVVATAAAIAAAGPRRIGRAVTRALGRGTRQGAGRRGRKLTGRRTSGPSTKRAAVSASTTDAASTGATAGTTATASTRRAAAQPSGDDLKRILGIGPRIEESLRSAGISTFSDLAGKTPDELAAILREDGRSADTGTWPEQARLAAAGDWAGLEQLRSTIDRGRRASAAGGTREPPRKQESTMTDEIPERDQDSDRASSPDSEGTAGLERLPEESRDGLDESSDESFPASDPPSYSSPTSMRPVPPED